MYIVYMFPSTLPCLVSCYSPLSPFNLNLKHISCRTKESIYSNDQRHQNLLFPYYCHDNLYLVLIKLSRDLSLIGITKSKGASK